MGFKLCIIADDFTGAGDSAVQFRRNGHAVFLGISDWEKDVDLSAYDVLVVSTESRFMDEASAYLTAREVVRRCGSFRIDHFFKKVDSTIRGNIASEIAAVMEEAGYDRVIVAPSAPKNNRTVVAGHCLVDGVPIGSASGVNDPFTPVHDSYVPALFEERFPGSVGLIDLSLIRQGPDAFQRELDALHSTGVSVIVADAETIDDLRVIASIKGDASILFAGASGLAEAMTRDGSIPEDFGQLPTVHAREMLFVLGSISSTSEEQFQRLSDATDLGIVSLDIGQMLEDEDRELRRLIGVARTFSGDRAIAVETLSRNGSVKDMLALARERGLSEKAFAAMVSSFLGRVVAAIFRLRTIRALFTTGGDTSARIAESLGVKGIELLSEVLPGIPLGRFQTPLSADPVYLVSKAGGFGPPDTLERILEAMTTGSHVSKGVAP